MRCFFLVILCAWLAPIGTTDAQTSDLVETREVLEWATRRNDVLQQLVSYPLRVASAAREIRAAASGNSDANEWRRAVAGSIERLTAAADQLDTVVQSLPPPPMNSDADRYSRMVTSYEGVLSVHDSIKDIQLIAIARLNELLFADQWEDDFLNLMSLDAEIAHIDAIISMKEVTRSDDTTNPGYWWNLASVEFNRINRSVSYLLRLEIEPTSEISEQELLGEIEASVASLRSHLVPLVTSAEDMVATTRDGIANDGAAAIERFAPFVAALEDWAATYEDVAAIYREAGRTADRLLNQYRAADPAEPHLAALSTAAAELQQSAIRSNEILTRQQQLAREAFRLHDTR